MTESPKPSRSYRFGPLERRGLVGSLRGGQVVCVGCACVVAVLVLNAAPSDTGVLIALVSVAIAVALAVVPISGRAADEWTPIAFAWIASGGRRRFRAPASTDGISTSLDGSKAQRPASLPPCLDGCRLLAVQAGDRTVGVMRDEQHSTVTAVVAVRVRAVGLLATSEHEARLARWGQVLAGLARNGVPIRRLQILQRALPAEGDGLWRHFLDARDPSSDDPQLEFSYTSLLDQTRQVTQDHEVLLAIQIDERRALARAGRDPRAQRMSRPDQANLVLLRELRTIVGRFEPTDVEIAGVLTAEQYAAAIRSAYDPYRHDEPYDGPDRVPGGLDFAPTAADTEWRSYRTEGAVHRTYWVSQWPRLAVGPLFMTPLLLGAHAVHSVSLVVEPIAPARSRRAVEAAITSDEADEELRERRGFRTTARRRRQQTAAPEREEELASGHEEVRFAGYVTVTGRTLADLDEACARVEQAAQQSYLELEPLWGEQSAGFVNGALPIGRGLAANRTGGLL